MKDHIYLIIYTKHTITQAQAYINMHIAILYNIHMYM